MAGSIILTWKGFYPYYPPFSEKGMLAAIQYDPDNPDPYYRLGIFYLWDIRHLNLEKALHYLKEAIKRNPLEYEYWLNLAHAFQKRGEYFLAEEALKRAFILSPTSFRSRWVGGNLFLQRGEYEKAIPHFVFILKNYPSQSRPVYEVWERAMGDRQFLLDKLVPEELLPLSQFLLYLYEVKDAQMAARVWEKRNSLGYKPMAAETLQHVDFLISQGQLPEAFPIFQNLWRQEGLITSEQNLITNGGFEEEKFWGKGFNWRVDQKPGFKISFDPVVFYEGKKSLLISFLGEENIDFRHIYQFVPLKSNQDYLLRAFLRTEALTTQSGIKLEVIGLNSSFRQSSPALTGNNEWQELVLSFRTPPETRGGIVYLRRERTEKFDRFISGKVWVDGVRLQEKKRPRKIN